MSNLLSSGAVPQPPTPMLAKLESTLPAGPFWRYEPKLDGFRGLLWRSNDGLVRLLSRNARDLAPWFPELLRAGVQLPVGTLLDGEIVIADQQGCPDFGALQHRLTVARKHTARVASERPAVLVVFDVLQLAGSDLTDLALDERRAHLERILSGQRSSLQLVLQTSDIEVARDWLKLLTTIEGVVAKRGDGRYAAGRRPEWVKVKRYRTVDCVVIGVTGERHAPRLVLGLRHDDDVVHHLGVTAVIPQAATGPILELIDRAGPLEAAIPSRWHHDAVPPWRRVPPELVCEVRAATLTSAGGCVSPRHFCAGDPTGRRPTAGSSNSTDDGLEQMCYACVLWMPHHLPRRGIPKLRSSAGLPASTSLAGTGF